MDFISALVHTEGRKECQPLNRWTAISKTSDRRFLLNVFEQSQFPGILYANLKCKCYHFYGQDIRFPDGKKKTMWKRGTREVNLKIVLLIPESYAKCFLS